MGAGGQKHTPDRNAMATLRQSVNLSRIQLSYLSNGTCVMVMTIITNIYRAFAMRHSAKSSTCVSSFNLYFESVRVYVNIYTYTRDYCLHLT